MSSSSAIWSTKLLHRMLSWEKGRTHLEGRKRVVFRWWGKVSCGSSRKTRENYFTFEQVLHVYTVCIQYINIVIIFYLYSIYNYIYKQYQYMPSTLTEISYAGHEKPYALVHDHPLTLVKIPQYWSCHICYLPSLSFTWFFASLGWERLPPLVEGIVQEPWAHKSSKNIEDTQNLMVDHGRAFSQHLTRAESHRCHLFFSQS
jgi:hypothetical protein